LTISSAVLCSLQAASAARRATVLVSLILPVSLCRCTQRFTTSLPIVYGLVFSLHAVQAALAAGQATVLISFILPVSLRLVSLHFTLRRPHQPLGERRVVRRSPHRRRRRAVTSFVSPAGCKIHAEHARAFRFRRHRRRRRVCGGCEGR
jgi:hypothetical protein